MLSLMANQACAAKQGDTNCILASSHRCGDASIRAPASLLGMRKQWLNTLLNERTRIGETI